MSETDGVESGNEQASGNERAGGNEEESGNARAEIVNGGSAPGIDMGIAVASSVARMIAGESESALDNDREASLRIQV